MEGLKDLEKDAFFVPLAKALVSAPKYIGKSIGFFGGHGGSTWNQVKNSFAGQSLLGAAFLPAGSKTSEILSKSRVGGTRMLPKSSAAGLTGIKPIKFGKAFSMLKPSNPIKLTGNIGAKFTTSAPKSALKRIG